MNLHKVIDQVHKINDNYIAMEVVMFAFKCCKIYEKLCGLRISKKKMSTFRYS